LNIGAFGAIRFRPKISIPPVSPVAIGAAGEDDGLLSNMIIAHGKVAWKIGRKVGAKDL